MKTYFSHWIFSHSSVPCHTMEQSICQFAFLASTQSSISLFKTTSQIEHITRNAMNFYQVFGKIETFPFISMLQNPNKKILRILSDLSTYSNRVYVYAYFIVCIITILKKIQRFDRTDHQLNIKICVYEHC